VGSLGWLLVAVVAGWMLQLWLSYRQSMAFTADARALRKSNPHCVVSVGAGGRRYRGGRAYVAIAVDQSGRVRDALVLSGFTTFARSAALPRILGLRANVLAGDREIVGLSTAQREAAQQAAQLLKQGSGTEGRVSERQR
jgi:DNA-binding transcriptional regulator of glucitol operon